MLLLKDEVTTKELASKKSPPSIRRVKTPPIENKGVGLTCMHANMAINTEYSYLVDHYRLSDEDCNKPVSKKHFEELSSLCEPWRKLPQYLGLKATVEGDLERDFKTEEEKRVGFIRKWKERKGFDATYKMLIKALLHIKSRLVVRPLANNCIFKKLYYLVFCV